MDQAFKDNSNWGKSPYIFKIEREFTTMQQVLTHLLATNDDGAKNKGDYHNLISKSVPGDFLTRPSQTDTTVGGNDVINCYYQFCENDDIIHPINAIHGNPNLGGLGRVYAETIDSPQQVLYMTMGVPKFNNLTAFYSDLMNKGLADFVNTGDSSFATMLGKFIGTGIAVTGTVLLAFSIPYLPMVYLLKKTVDVVADKVDQFPVTKYYDFSATMPMYYRYVNGIMAHLAINMGLYPDGNGGTTQGAQYNDTYKKMYTEANSNAIPDVFKNGGLSIFKILAKRDQRLRPDGSIPDDEEYLLGERKEDESGWFSGFLPRLTSSMFGADRFVGFRVEKTTDSSESIGNNTGESSIAQTLNSTAAGARDKWFSFANGKVMGGVVDGFLESVSGVISAALDSVGMGGLSTGASILTGSGYVDIPEVWQGSNFSKSYSFKMTLRSPSGDPLSIMQSIYIPLSCLLAAALPRSVGQNSYTSPFLIRAYCKGMFAIPMGIIDSMTITRGASEFGWTNSKLPTVIEVSFTIKDLSPVMHMAMMDRGETLLNIFGQNSSFQEYMLTLSGLGLSERLLWFENVKRKFETSLNMYRNTWGSPLYWATTLGNSTVARLIGMLSPFSRFNSN